MPIVNIPNLGRFRIPEGVSDEERDQLIRGLVDMSGAQPKGPQGIGEVFSNAVARGAKQMLVGTAYDLPALGLAGLAKLGFGGAEEKALEFLGKGAQRYAAIEQELPTQYRDVTKLEGPGQYLGFAVEQAGQGLPSIASALLPGGIAAATGRGAARKIAQEAAETALRSGVTREVAERIGEKAAQDALAGRAGLAMMSSSYLQTAPESFRNIFEETKQLEPGLALATGLANSFIESYIPGKILGDLGLYGRTKLVEKALERGGFTKEALRIGAKASGIAAQEGLTEAAQDIINSTAVKIIDENYQVFSPENINKYLNSFAAGAAAGAGPGLLGAAVDRTRPVQTPPETPPRGGVISPTPPPVEPVAPQQVGAVQQPVAQGVPQAQPQVTIPPVTPAMEMPQAVPPVQPVTAAPQASLPAVTQPAAPPVAPPVTSVQAAPPVQQAAPPVTQPAPPTTVPPVQAVTAPPSVPQVISQEPSVTPAPQITSPEVTVPPVTSTPALPAPPVTPEPGPPEFVEPPPETGPAPLPEEIAPVFEYEKELLGRREALEKGKGSLWSALKGRISYEDIKDASPDIEFRTLAGNPTNPNFKGLDLMVKDGDLDAWLPPELQSTNFDRDPTLETVAVNSIKERLADKDLLTDATKQELEIIDYELSQIIPLIREYESELERELAVTEAAEAAQRERLDAEQAALQESLAEAVPKGEAGVARPGETAGQRPIPAVTQAVTAPPTVPQVTAPPVTAAPVLPKNAIQAERDMFTQFRDELDRLGLKDLNLEFIRPKRTKTGYTLGEMATYVTRDIGATGNETLKVTGRLLRVAIDLAKRTKSSTAQNPERIKRTLHHEVIHALRSMNLFTADEWRILSEASAKDWVKRKWPDDYGMTVEQIYRKESKDTKLEEGVARAFEYYTRGEFQPAGAVARIFQKTKEFFKKLADYAMGLGITETEAEVFERIMSGEIGSRVRKDQTLYKQPYDKVSANIATKEDKDTLQETEEIILNAANLDVDPETSMNNLVKSGPDFNQIKNNTRDYIKDLATDKADILLSTLNLRQLGEIASDALPQIKKFYRAVNDMLAYRDTRITKAADIATPWVAFNDKNPELARALADVMHDATIAGIDPDTRLDEIKNPELLKNWEKVSANPEALKIYREVRDYYAESLDLYQKALEQRINESMEEGRPKTAALLKLEQEFNRIRETGPYFPLARFGDYWVSFDTFNDEGKKVPEYYMFESRNDQRQFIDQLNKQGIKHKSGVKTREMISQGIPMTGFVREMMDLVDGMDGDKEALKDNIWQMFLTMQPDLSARKHFIHRKKVAGYSPDALRAFAETSFHGAYHLARVRYNGSLEALVLEARKYKEENPSVEADRYFDELLRRKQWVNAPEDVNSFNSWATSFSFLYFLTAPASALVNIAQTPMVAFPYLGGKFGYGKTFSALSQASKDFFASGIGKGRGFYDVIRTLQERVDEKGISDRERKRREEELGAMQKLYEDGTLNRTQTLSLAGLAERPSDVLQGGLGSVMRNKSFTTVQKVTYGLGYAFNQAEVFNRQITALAAYRLAKERGLTPDVALQMAKDIVNETHFEYTNATKPRFMQGPTARIIFQFKNYAQQMTYLLVRTVNEAVRDADPEVRREAQKRLGGILFMTGLFAGYEGLPMYWVIEGVMNAMFDDEDEPYDFNNSAKNTIADLFGSNAARILSKGAVSEVLGGDVANRVGMNGMWFRDSNKSADEVEAFRQFVTDLAGPFVGIGVNISDGIKKINDGNTYRGIEAMLPPVLKDFMKVGRMATEGATTLRGDPIVGEVSTWGLFLQALGFTPVDIARGYEAMAEIKGMDKDLDQRRKRLLQQVTLAQINGDYTAFGEIYDKIEAFNEKNPENPISKESIKRSLAQRVKDTDRALRGIIVNPKREYLLDEARYLGEED
jgi:hypothetical protein